MKDVHEIPIECKIDGPPDSADGVYRIPHNMIDKYVYLVIFSAGLGWERMSVSLLKMEKNKAVKVERCPTWPEMCFLKDVFWHPEECCVQYHPPMSQYISNHQYCLHVWRSTAVEIPTPDSVLVGLKGLDELLAWLKENFPKLPIADIDMQRILYYADASSLTIGDEKSEDEFRSRVKTTLRVLFNIADIRKS